MDLVSVECPSCAATLPPREPCGHFVCDYCGSRFAAKQVKTAKTQYGAKMSPEALLKAIVAQHREGDVAPAQVVLQQNMAQARQKTRAAAKLGRRIALFGVATSLLVTGAVVFTIVNAQKDRAMQALGAISEQMGEVANVQQAVNSIGEAVARMGWDDVGGEPIPVEIGGRPAVLGRTRAYGVDSLYIDAYDATTAERLWRVDGLGTYSDGYRNIFAGVWDDRVVVSDARGNLTVHELATGEEVHRHALTDKVVDICVPPAGTQAGKNAGSKSSPRVWVHQKDERNHFIDVQTGDLSEAKRPKWCFKSRAAARRAANRSPKLRKPSVKGTKLKRVAVDGDLAVAAGVKSPGTAVPRIVGFHPKTRKVAWEEEVPQVDPATVRENSSEWGRLVDGQYVTTYGAGRDAWHITAFDAETGARLWDTKLRSIFSVDRLTGLVVANARAYLVRTGCLEIYDTKDGRLLGVVGTVNYDD